MQKVNVSMASKFGGSSFGRVLREAAPRLSRRFFTCDARPVNQPQRCGRFASQLIQTKRTAPPIPRPIQNVSQITFQARAFSHGKTFRSAVTAETSQAAKSSFPPASSNTVAYWLLASAASVFGIVVFGGLTRLTESGLSITEWRPVTGSLPPLSDADWESEFTKYRSSPEFHLLNSRMTLEEFKSIYWMEWIHRLWGRAVGLTFIVPAIYFVARKKVSKPMTFRLAGIASLIGFQGFLGWWMVKSGLTDDLFTPGSTPRVSQYRLAAHLGTAFVCYLAMLWNGLDILRTNKLLAMSSDAATASLYSLRNPALKTFKLSVALLAGLVFTTAMSGALVAGLDAGLIYNDFPYMGEGFAPPKKELFDPFYSRDKENNSDLWWRNMLENPSLVQLDHRILATSTFTAVMALFAYTKFSPGMRTFLPKAAMRGVHGVVGFAWLQVILGITTLMWLVPLPLASAHQAGALALLTWTTVLGSRIWYPKAAARALQQRMNQAAGTIKPHDFPAVAKVRPNWGQPEAATGSPLVQSSAGAIAASAVAFFVGSQRPPSTRGPDSNANIDHARHVFLEKQMGVHRTG